MGSLRRFDSRKNWEARKIVSSRSPMPEPENNTNSNKEEEVS